MSNAKHNVLSCFFKAEYTAQPCFEKIGTTHISMYNSSTVRLKPIPYIIPLYRQKKQ